MRPKRSNGRWRTAAGRRVLDLGAGTGKLTSTLVSLGFDVVAVERDPAMLTELRAWMPAVTCMLGSAEAIPLPDGSVDAVLAGNAMHWFDMTAASSEMARVLAPSGVVAGLWNLMDDGVDWVAQLAKVGGLRRLARVIRQAAGRARRLRSTGR